MRISIVLLAAVIVLCCQVIEARTWLEFIFGSKSTESIEDHSTTSSSYQGFNRNQRNRQRDIDGGLQAKHAPVPSIKHNYRKHNTSHIGARHSLEEHIARGIKEKIFQFGHLTEVVFIGDSTFYQWAQNKTIWGNIEKSYAAISIMGPGDKTENVLHRLDERYMTNITSSATALIFMGHSNIAVGDPPESIVKALLMIAEKWVDKHPKGRVVLFSPIPRPLFGGNATSPGAQNNLRFNSICFAVNALLKIAADKKSLPKGTEYVDITPQFSVNGVGSPEFFRSKLASILSVSGQTKMLSIVSGHLSKLKKITRPLPDPIVHLHLKSLQKLNASKFNATLLASKLRARWNASNLKNVSIPAHAALTSKQAAKLISTVNATKQFNVSSILRAVNNRNIKTSVNMTKEFKEAVQKNRANVNVTLTVAKVKDAGKVAKQSSTPAPAAKDKSKDAPAATDKSKDSRVKLKDKAKSSSKHLR